VPLVFLFSYLEVVQHDLDQGGPQLRHLALLIDQLLELRQVVEMVQQDKGTEDEIV
jgi:hypothetical protein